MPETIKQKPNSGEIQHSQVLDLQDAKNHSVNFAQTLDDQTQIMSDFFLHNQLVLWWKLETNIESLKLKQKVRNLLWLLIPWYQSSNGNNEHDKAFLMRNKFLIHDKKNLFNVEFISRVVSILDPTIWTNKIVIADEIYKEQLNDIESELFDKLNFKKDNEWYYRIEYWKDYPIRLISRMIKEIAPYIWGMFQFGFASIITTALLNAKNNDNRLKLTNWSDKPIKTDYLIAA